MITRKIDVTLERSFGNNRGNPYTFFYKCPCIDNACSSKVNSIWLKQWSITSKGLTQQVCILTRISTGCSLSSRRSTWQNHTVLLPKQDMFTALNLQLITCKRVSKLLQCLILVSCPSTHTSSVFSSEVRKSFTTNKADFEWSSQESKPSKYNPDTSIYGRWIKAQLPLPTQRVWILLQINYDIFC